MLLYFPSGHYDKTHRGAVFPLLKPFIKNEGFTDKERIRIYGLSEKDFSFTPDFRSADLAILTMSWNFYVKTGRQSLVLDFIESCKRQKKKVLVWISGDHGMKMKKFPHVYILRESGYRSGFSENEQGLPSFIRDPLIAYFHTNSPILLPYASKAQIGFCGQADSSRMKAIKEMGMISYRNLSYYLNFTAEEPETILSSTYLRSSVLKHLEKSEKVGTDFIFRKQYRAGVTENKQNHPTTLEFYENLKNNPYNICVRGGGNFSVRFYETLAMGRIPIFIDTDSPLPFYDQIDWERHLVRVDVKDKSAVDQAVFNFHQKLDEETFIDLQKSNRKLWEEKFTLKGYFLNLLKQFNLKQ